MSEKLWGQYGGRKLTGIGFALTGMRPLASTSIWCNSERLTDMCFGLTEIRPCVTGSRNSFIPSGRGFDSPRLHQSAASERSLRGEGVSRPRSGAWRYFPLW